VRTLSGGQRQAIAIGRAIYWQASVLIMDEPTAAPGRTRAAQRPRADPAPERTAGRRDLHLAQPLVDIFAVADRILVVRRGRAAGERRTPETDHDEIVKLMVGAESIAA
jgi:simple sugar transport system ATP-binding protein